MTKSIDKEVRAFVRKLHKAGFNLSETRSIGLQVASLSPAEYRKMLNASNKTTTKPAPPSATMDLVLEIKKLSARRTNRELSSFIAGDLEDKGVLSSSRAWEARSGETIAEWTARLAAHTGEARLVSALEAIVSDYKSGRRLRNLA